MNYPPRQLALLISLIGAGASPCAQARIGVPLTEAWRALPGLHCSESEAAALPACVRVPEMTWQPERSALDLSGTPGVLLLYNAPRDDATASEEPADDLGAASPPTWPVGEVVPTAEPVRPLAPAVGLRKAGGKTRRLHALAKGVVTARFEPAALERISAVALTDSPTLTDTRPVAAEWKAVDAGVPDGYGPSDNPSSAPGPTKAEADSPAARVLRQLHAIRSRTIGDTGVGPRAPTAVSESAKVLDMLQGIAAPLPPVTSVGEDGPAKRARKLAAREAKAEAQAAAEAVAAGQVDVLLPLEQPVVAAAPTASGGVASVPTQAPIPQAGAAHHVNPFGDRQVAVAATALDRVRGGFSGDGLNISFGIERAVYINGALVTSTTMNVTDLGQAAAGRAGAPVDAGTVALIQNGTGNSVATGAISRTAVGTVIQNTLDGQKIQNITVINATANSLGLYRGFNLGASLRGAVIDSLRH